MVNFTYTPSTLSLLVKTKAKYKVRNWDAYDAALKQGGSITFWMGKVATANVLYLPPYSSDFNSAYKIE